VQHTTCATIYLPEYMSMLQLPHDDPLRFYQEVIVPTLLKNHNRLPETIRHLLTQAVPAEDGQ
jgi:hypothetical protein